MALHWTTVEDIGFNESLGRYRPQEADFDLPDIFWHHLSDVLQLLVAAEVTALNTQEGHYIADQLKPFIQRIRGILSTQRLSVQKSASLRNALGYALLTYGQQRGDKAALEEAITVYRAALREYTAEEGVDHTAPPRHTHSLTHEPKPSLVNGRYQSAKRADNCWRI